MSHAAQNLRHMFRSVIVLTEFVGESRVGVHTDRVFRHAPQFFYVLPQLIRAQGAIEAHRGGLRVAYRVVERLGGLPREGAPALVGNRAGDHDRNGRARFPVETPHRIDRRFGVEGVKNRLDHEEVHASLDKPPSGVGVILRQGVKGDRPEPGIVHIGR